MNNWYQNIKGKIASGQPRTYEIDAVQLVPSQNSEGKFTLWIGDGDSLDAGIDISQDISNQINSFLAGVSTDRIMVDATMHYMSSVDYDPGVWGNRMEDAIPPSGDVDISDVSVVIKLTADDGRDFEFILPEDISDKVFAKFQDTITEKESMESQNLL